jgi:hypothetical protein
MRTADEGLGKLTSPSRQVRYHMAFEALLILATGTSQC